MQNASAKIQFLIPFNKFTFIFFTFLDMLYLFFMRSKLFLAVLSL